MYYSSKIKISFMWSIRKVFFLMNLDQQYDFTIRLVVIFRAHYYNSVVLRIFKNMNILQGVNHIDMDQRGTLIRQDTMKRMILNVHAIPIYLILTHTKGSHTQRYDVGYFKQLYNSDGLPTYGLNLEGSDGHFKCGNCIIQRG